MGSWHGVEISHTLPQKVCLIAAKEKELVLYDGPTERASGTIIDVLWLFGTSRLEIRLGLERIGFGVPIRGPVERIGSAFDLHVNARSIHHSLSSGRTGGHHVYNPELFGRWGRRRVEVHPEMWNAQTHDTEICT